MTQPKWSEKAPEKAGWYWVRGKNEPEHPAKVFKSKTGLLCFISTQGAKMGSDLQHYQWAVCIEPVE